MKGSQQTSSSLASVVSRKQHEKQFHSAFSKVDARMKRDTSDSQSMLAGHVAEGESVLDAL
jgi:hypothetical protein